MDVHLSDVQLVSAGLVVAAHVLGRVTASGRRRVERAGGLVEVIMALPPGSRLAEVRPDGTVVRVDLPGQPTTSPPR